MITYYKRSGVHAVVALLLNGLILLATLSWLGAVLTLPGIAGLILTIGMAVDSNVLVFERIREELRAGKAAYAAMEAGFQARLRDHCGYTRDHGGRLRMFVLLRHYRDTRLRAHTGDRSDRESCSPPCLYRG